MASKVKTRRKTYPDNLINQDIIDKLIDKVFDSVSSPYENTQQNVVKILLPLGFSNKIIAKVINATVIDSNATAGSVAMLVRRVRDNAKVQSKILEQLGEE